MTQLLVFWHVDSAIMSWHGFCGAIQLGFIHEILAAMHLDNQHHDEPYISQSASWRCFKSHEHAPCLGHTIGNLLGCCLRCVGISSRYGSPFGSSTPLNG